MQQAQQAYATQMSEVQKREALIKQHREAELLAKAHRILISPLTLILLDSFALLIHFFNRFVPPNNIAKISAII